MRHVVLSGLVLLTLFLSSCAYLQGYNDAGDPLSPVADDLMLELGNLEVDECRGHSLMQLATDCAMIHNAGDDRSAAKYNCTGGKNGCDVFKERANRFLTENINEDIFAYKFGLHHINEESKTDEVLYNLVGNCEKESGSQYSLGILPSPYRLSETTQITMRLEMWHCKH